MSITVARLLSDVKPKRPVPDFAYKCHVPPGNAPEMVATDAGEGEPLGL
jgi:hypothetical protein